MLKSKKLQSALMQIKNAKLSNRKELINQIRNDTEEALLKFPFDVPCDALEMRIELKNVSTDSGSPGILYGEIEFYFSSHPMGLPTTHVSHAKIPICNNVLTLVNEKSEIITEGCVSAEIAMIGNSIHTFLIPVTEIFDGNIIIVDLSKTEET